MKRWIIPIIIFLAVAVGLVWYIVDRRNWPTFEKDTYGYSFRYPKEWTPNDDKDSNSNTRYVDFTIGENQYFSLSLLFPKSSYCSDLSSCVDKLRTPAFEIVNQREPGRYEDISEPIERLSGENRYYTQQLRWSSGGISQQYWFYVDGIVVHGTNNGIQQETVDRIIRTFRIDASKSKEAESNFAQYNWDKYENAKYGFIISYPSTWYVLDYPYEKDQESRFLQFGLYEGGSNSGYMRFTVEVDDCNSFEECRNQYIHYAKDHNISEQFSPFDGYRVETLDISGEPAIHTELDTDYNVRDEYFIYNNNHLLHFRFQKSDRDQYRESLNERIIDSLEFN